MKRQMKRSWMKRPWMAALLAALLLLLASCETGGNDPALATEANGLLSGIPVAGTLADGGTFEGALSITELAFENGDLLVSGVLEGTATQGGTVTEISQTFTDVVANLTQQGGSCRILLLEIPGGLTLDVLGLVVDLAPVELEIRAERGPGNLLGNLLCALVGLLDQGGPLSGIQNLLDQINNLL